MFGAENSKLVSRINTCCQSSSVIYKTMYGLNQHTILGYFYLFHIYFIYSHVMFEHLLVTELQNRSNIWINLVILCIFSCIQLTVTPKRDNTDSINHITKAFHWITNRYITQSNLTTYQYEHFNATRAIYTDPIIPNITVIPKGSAGLSYTQGNVELSLCRDRCRDKLSANGCGVICPNIKMYGS